MQEGDQSSTAGNNAPTVQTPETVAIANSQFAVLWLLRREGIQIRNDRPTSREKAQEWQQRYISWRDRLMAELANSTSPGIYFYIQTLNEITVNIPGFDDEHTLMVSCLNEELRRLERWLGTVDGVSR